MFKIQERIVLLNSRIAVAICAVVLLVLGSILIIQGFIDTKNYSDIIRQTIKERTGRDVTIRGKVSISLLPTPTIVVPGLELRDAISEKPAPALSIAKMHLSVSFGSLFSDEPHITGITLDNPVLEITRAYDNYIHWEWLSKDLFVDDGISNILSDELELNIRYGKIMYLDKRTDKGLVFNNINLTSDDVSNIAFNGGFNVMDTNISISSSTDEEGRSSGNVRPLRVTLSAGDKGSVTLNGSVDASGEELVVKGDLVADMPDMMRWVHARARQLEAEQQIFDKLEGKSVYVDSDDGTPLPLKVTAKWNQSGENIELENFKLDGLNSSGVGEVTLGWQKWYPVVEAKFDFDGLDYNQWHRFLTGIFMDNRVVDPNNYYRRIYNEDNNPLPRDIDFTLQARSKQLFVSSQIWKDFSLSAQLADASVTVNTFSVNLPGESNLMLFGIISQGNTGGLRFEGSMETAGESLRQMLTVFDESAADLPETGFGDFFARANIFVSPEQVRLSEADVKLSDLRLNGGLVAYFDASPRLEADVKLKDINFDYFRDVWREKNLKSKREQFFLRFDKQMKFNWLKRLQTNIDLKVSVNKFTFLERPGDTASFRIFVKPYEFGVYDMRFNYPYETLQASFNLNVTGEQPYINVVLNTNEMDMDYFNLEPQVVQVEVRPSNTFKGIKGAVPPEDEMQETTTFVGIDGAIPPADGVVGISKSFVGVTGAVVAPPSARKRNSKEVLEITPQNNLIQLAQAEGPSTKITLRKADAPKKDDAKAMLEIDRDRHGVATSLWDTRLINMSWMDGFNGSFDISIGRLIYGDISLDRLKMQAKLENNLVTFQNLAFLYWQGRCSVLGSIYGGKVPGLSLSFTLFNLELGDMVKDLTGRRNISGKASLSGTLTTSGVNTLSWVSQSESKLVVAARGVNVRGINLQGVVDTLMVSRTAADVFNNVNIALINGSTNFTVDGNINVKNGIMRTPGITLRAGNITGDLSGEVKLVPWRMELSTLFQFPTITSETIPTMTVQNTGPVESSQIRTDTSSLEAYVAKRIISK
jgi:hypothetical protein